MGKTEFAQTIIKKMDDAIGKDGLDFSEDSASVAMQAMADGITEYLINNTQVDVAYVGTIPATPPVPDPLVADSFSIVGECPPPAVSGDFETWLLAIEANIIAGFQLAESGENGLSFPLFPFTNLGLSLSQSSLKDACDDSPEDPQLKVWELICGAIMDWINGLAMNVTSGAATNPLTSSTGTANIVKITLS